jgi:hypothetical protein
MKGLHLRTGLCLLVLTLVLCSSGSATTYVQNKDEPLSLRNDLKQAEFGQSMKVFRFSQSPFLAQETEASTGKENVDIYGFKGKSLKKAFALSLLVPGSGEFYAGSKIKAAVFLGIDVTLWALYFNYHGKGKDKEDEYRSYADLSWSRDEYMQYLIDSLDITDDRQPYWNGKDSVYLSHHLPDSKTGQYYEMIGKYEQFRWGWLDYDDQAEFSANREIYLDMRHDSNSLLNKATYSAMFSLANHILSAFDAAVSVKRYNKKGERFSQLKFKVRLVERERDVIPRLTLGMEF